MLEDEFTEASLPARLDDSNVRIFVVEDEVDGETDSRDSSMCRRAIRRR